MLNFESDTFYTYLKYSLMCFITTGISLFIILTYQFVRFDNALIEKEDLSNWYAVDRETKEILMGNDTYELLIRTYLRKIKYCKYCQRVIENK